MDKKIHAKMVDYKRFTVILVCLAIFSYMGSIITIVQNTEQTGFMMGISALLTAGAGIFFLLSVSYKKKMNEEDTNSL